MSASLSGKFQDHYAILGLDAKSDSDAIALAYARTSEKYHPDNPSTGSQEKFDAVTLAFEVLSDPVLRLEFDKVKGVSLEVGTPKFSGLKFFAALGRGTGLRLAVLCVLYDRRRARPFTPSLSMRHLENILQATEEELNFVLWYLKQRNMVSSDDKSSLQITVDGMDFLEKNQPAPEMVMPFVKTSGLSPQALHAPEALVPEESAENELSSLAAALEPVAEHPVASPVIARVREAPQEHESVQSVLRRARARG